MTDAPRRPCLPLEGPYRKPGWFALLCRRIGYLFGAQ